MADRNRSASPPRATTAGDADRPRSPRATTHDDAEATARAERGHRRATIADDASAGAATAGHRRPTTADDANDTTRGYSLIALPPELSSRFTVVRHLGGGGEAQVLLCTNNADGREVAIKLYLRDSDRLDLELLRRLQTVDPAHVATLYEVDRNAREAWEVMEYFPAGTLAELMAASPAPWSTRRITDVVTELHGAISSLPDKVSHRDVKPPNVFVRTVEPLDLVLGDFGTVFQRVGPSTTFDMVVGTHGYMPPEGLAGRVSEGFDWWALGIITYELLVGRHPLADPDGTMPDNNRLRAEGYDPVIDTDAISDPRWRLLVRGLTRRDYHDRWGGPEVASWLAGGSPEVKDQSASARATTGSSARPRPINLLDAVHYTPEEISATFRARSEDAADYLSSRAHEELLDWFRLSSVGHQADDVFASLGRRTARPNRSVVELQLLLTPNEDPGYRGRLVSTDSLNLTIGAARGGVPEAQQWITHLIDERILSLMASYRHDDELSGADERLRMWISGRDRLVTSLPDSLRSLIAAPTTDALLVAAALDQDARAAVLSQGRRDFAGQRPDGYPDHEPTNPGEAVVATGVLPAWRDAQAREREATRLAEEAREQQRNEATQRQRREELDRQLQAARDRRTTELRAVRRRVGHRIAGFAFFFGCLGVPIAGTHSVSWTSLAVESVIAVAIVVGGASLVDVLLTRKPARSLGWLTGFTFMVIQFTTWVPKVRAPATIVLHYPSMALSLAFGYAVGSAAAELMGRMLPTRTTEPWVASRTSSATALIMGAMYLVLRTGRPLGLRASDLTQGLAKWYQHLMHWFITTTHTPKVTVGVLQTLIVVCVVLALFVIAARSGADRIPARTFRALQLVQIALTLLLIWVAPGVFFIAAYYLGVVALVVAIGAAILQAVFG